MTQLYEMVLEFFSQVRNSMESHNINEQLLKLQTIIEENKIDDIHYSHRPINDSIWHGDIITRSIHDDRVLISNGREAIWISQSYVKYTYKSKYLEDHHRHIMVATRNPWQYCDHQNNVTPLIAIRFLERYMHRLKKEKL